MKVKFVTDAVVLVEGKPETLFSQGDVQDLNAHSAERWIRRGVAEEHTGEVVKKSSKKRAAKSDSSADG